MDPSQGTPAQQPPAYQPGQGAPAAYSLTEKTEAPPSHEHPPTTAQPLADQPQGYYAPPPQGQMPPGQATMQPQTMAGPPSRAATAHFGEDDPTGMNYTRDPHKLTAYLVPFPQPHLKNAAAAEKVSRTFL